MELLKLLSTNEIVAQIVCFLVLLAILRPLLWKRILVALDRRKERIAEEQRNIEEARLAAESLKSDYEKRIARIEDEARERIDAAIVQGRKIADEIRKRGEADAARILENSKESIKAEIAKAKEALKNEIVNLTIAVTEKIIQEKYTEADDKRLIADYLKEIERP